MNIERKQPIRNAVDEWGEEAQVDTAVEELAELIHAIQKFKRGRASNEEVLSELADVQIMLDQLAVIHGEGDASNQLESALDDLQGKLKTAQDE